MLYEAMLLFALVFISDWVFAVSVEQRHALYLRHALQALLFFVMGMYFIWCWSHGGQTLAMKTWRVRLIEKDDSALSPWRALIRYLLAWLWILPGLAIAWAIGAKGWVLVLVPFLNLILWGLTAYLDPQRQFLHDRLAGTCLVNANPDQN